MTDYTVLASGSTGNAILLRGSKALLLDAGVPARSLVARLRAAGCDPRDLEGIVVTHEHLDHSSGAAHLARMLDVPVFGTAGTLAALRGPQASREVVGARGARRIGGFDVHFFPVAHDAADPVGVRVWRGDRSLAYLTDTGKSTNGVVAALRGAHHFVTESNHDVDLLRAGPYHEALKRRIQGGRGHLSNDACGALLRQVVGPDTRRVVLHHLSRRNNTPELALATNHAILGRHAGHVPELVAAPAHEALGPFRF